MRRRRVHDAMRHPCCEPWGLRPLAATLITTACGKQTLRKRCASMRRCGQDRTVRPCPRRGPAVKSAALRRGRSVAERREFAQCAGHLPRPRAPPRPRGKRDARNALAFSRGVEFTWRPVQRGSTTISFFNEMYDGDVAAPGLRSGHGLGAPDAARGDRPEEGGGRGAVPAHRHHLRGLRRGRRHRAADPVRHDAPRVHRARMAQARARRQAARPRAERLPLRRLPPRRDHPRRA